MFCREASGFIFASCLNLCLFARCPDALSNCLSYAIEVFDDGESNERLTSDRFLREDAKTASETHAYLQFCGRLVSSRRNLLEVKRSFKPQFNFTHALYGRLCRIVDVAARNHSGMLNIFCPYVVLKNKYEYVRSYSILLELSYYVVPRYVSDPAPSIQAPRLHSLTSTTHAPAKKHELNHVLLFFFFASCRTAAVQR